MYLLNTIVRKRFRYYLTCRSIWNRFLHLAIDGYKLFSQSLTLILHKLGYTVLYTILRLYFTIILPIQVLLTEQVLPTEIL